MSTLASPARWGAQRARSIAHGITRPLIADADTGFGGLINIRHTVRGYEEAGVQAIQAIQLEDRESPKKCGHAPNRRVVPLADAVRATTCSNCMRLSASRRCGTSSGGGPTEDFLRGGLVARTHERAV